MVFLIPYVISFMNGLNIKGFNSEPWSTPLITLEHSEYESLITPLQIGPLSQFSVRLRPDYLRLLKH